MSLATRRVARGSEGRGARGEGRGASEYRSGFRGRVSGPAWGGGRGRCVGLCDFAWSGSTSGRAADEGHRPGFRGSPSCGVGGADRDRPAGGVLRQTGGLNPSHETRYDAGRSQFGLTQQEFLQGFEHRGVARGLRRTKPICRTIPTRSAPIRAVRAIRGHLPRSSPRRECLGEKRGGQTKPINTGVNPCLVGFLCDQAGNRGRRTKPIRRRVRGFRRVSCSWVRQLGGGRRAALARCGRERVLAEVHDWSGSRQTKPVGGGRATVRVDGCGRHDMAAAGRNGRRGTVRRIGSLGIDRDGGSFARFASPAWAGDRGTPGHVPFRSAPATRWDGSVSGRPAASSRDPATEALPGHVPLCSPFAPATLRPCCIVFVIMCTSPRDRRGQRARRSRSRLRDGGLEEGTVRTCHWARILRGRRGCRPRPAASPPGRRSASA